MLKVVFASALVLSSCLSNPEPAPNPVSPPETEPGPPHIVHTGKDLVLYPLEAVQESVYVAGKEGGAWTVSLRSAPSGAYFTNPLITYRIPEGLSGPQEVRAIATRPGFAAMETSWTVIAKPNANQPASFTHMEIPAWIVGGTKLRVVFHANDPDGDPTRFQVVLPADAVMQDSILEWSPPAGKAVSANFTISVADHRGAGNAKTFSVQSLSYDPKTFAAMPVPGRSWWIKGYISTKVAGKSDSNRVRRRITVTSGDSATGAFAFRLIDTLGNADTAARDTLINAVSKPGLGFVSAVENDGGVPFSWPMEAAGLENRTYSFQGKDYAAKWLFIPNSCLNGGGSKYSCGGSEAMFAEGLGQMVRESKWQASFVQQYANDSLAVWAVSGP